MQGVRNLGIQCVRQANVANSQWSAAYGMHRQIVERWKLMAQLLGVSEEEGRQIVYKHAVLQRIDENKLRKSIDQLRQLDVSTGEIKKHPEILSHLAKTIEQRYCSLKELGLQPVGLPEVLRYTTLMKKNYLELRSLKLLPEHVHPADHLLGQLKLLDPSACLQLYPNIRNLSLLAIRKALLLECLSRGLEGGGGGGGKAEALGLLHKYPAVGSRSIVALQRTIRLLTDTLQFSSAKIKSNGFLLTVNPSNAFRILEIVSQIGFPDAPSFVRSHPMILRMPSDHLLQTSACLKRFGITDEQLLQCGSILLLKPETVERRLKEISESSDFEAMQSYPRILSLACQFEKAKQRMSYLKAAGFSSAPMNALDASESRFCSSLLGLQDRRAKVQEAVEHLRGRLECSESDVKLGLQQHPFLQKMPFDHVVDVCTLLLDEEGFGKAQVLNALPIVLHDKLTVRLHLRKLPLHDDVHLFGDWRRHPYILQLVLYLVEKDSYYDVVEATEEQRDKSAPNSNASFMTLQGPSAEEGT